MSKDLFISKAACLLHDPPNKAWLLKGVKDHEEEAKRIATEILANTCLREAIERMEDIARRADILASSVDRWLLGKIIGKEYHLFPVKEIKLKNIFNPKFFQEVRQEQPSTDEFIENLRSLIKDINDPRLAYHILYASYETTWIQLGLPVSPADTRAPSHSVFDHNYATTSMANWLLEKNHPEGILLYIDLGGPQRFISSSRKLSDLWLSSYLASGLAWSIFWIFLRALGPDVMVLPTCRENPFYYHSLISELTRNGVNEVIIEKIKRISGEFAGYDPDRDKIPRYATVPVTATFMLPGLEQLKELNDFKEIELTKGLEGLEEFVRKKYQEIWRGIYDEVIKECNNLQDELDKLAVEVSRLLNECKKFGFDKTPPLPIRVIALDTNEPSQLGLQEEKSYSLYHNMFKLLGYEEYRRKLYKFRPEEDLKLFEMTSQPIKTWPKEAKRGFEYCTVCGRLPAIIILPSEEEGEDEYKKYLNIELEPIFGMGERLCPYCLIKRLMSVRQILKSVIDKLIGEISGELPTFRFPSVSDIALMPFKKSFITNAIKIDNVQELAIELSRSIDEILKKFAEKGILQLKGEPITYIETKLAESIRKLKTNELKEGLEMILNMDAEACFLRAYKIKKDKKEETYSPRRDWLELKERIYSDERMERHMNLEKEKIEDLNTYYAIIRCDGDNLSKIIHGKVGEGFRITIEDYLRSVLEGPVAKVISAILDNDYEKAKEICEQYNVKEIDKRIKDVSGLINRLKEEDGIIISPSYHSALSRALMANAVRDKEIVDRHDGLTIYAGGDDLLAITPVRNSLSTVQELRKSFSFPSAEYKGFYYHKNLSNRRNGYLIPSLVTASRSFCIYLTHYMFPLYSAISRSTELLDDIAKNSRWMVGAKGRMEEGLKKDTVVLSYSPRGGELCSVLPLSDIKATNQNLAKSLKYIDELVSQIGKERDGFSSSLIYDLNENLQTIKQLIDKRSETLLKMLIERIFERNCEVQGKQRRKEMAERWSQRLMEDYDVSDKVDHDTLLFLEQFFLALMLYRSGLRGAE
ncbi:MAG: type III-B CRISPR-associated protein Cas10/Cmr2 [Nitrososphaerales archaeon]